MTYIQWVTVITRPKYRIGKAQKVSRNVVKLHPFLIPKSRNLSKYPGVTSDCLVPCCQITKCQHACDPVAKPCKHLNCLLHLCYQYGASSLRLEVLKSKVKFTFKVKSFKARLARFLWSQIHMFWATLNNHIIQYLQPKMKMYLILKLTLVAACVSTVQNEQVSWKDMKVCLY